jgi:uncharacterized damage-inducible protein DinB
MITPSYAQTMARYNRWQNHSLYTAADGLPDELRKADRGAFFGSIQRTLDHLLWADQTWMSRFAQTPRPEASSLREWGSRGVPDWSELKSARTAFDEILLSWASALDARWLEGDLTWFSGAAGREVTRPKWLLVTHLFNHQTHHRGQVHAMLTAAGAKPADTDLAFMPA